MTYPLVGAPPKPQGFDSWTEWANYLCSFLELQGDSMAQLALTGLAATPTVLGFQQIVGLASSTALTVPSGTRVAFVQAESQAVRWRDDGVNPTAGIGSVIAVGETLAYAGNLANLKLIQTAATAILNIQYRR